MEKVIHCCMIICQDVENFDENMVLFLNDPILGNIRILECYFNLIWMVTSYSFIF